MLDINIILESISAGKLIPEIEPDGIKIVQYDEHTFYSFYALKNEFWIRKDTMSGHFNGQKIGPKEFGKLLDAWRKKWHEIIASYQTEGD